jgi:hypothetical protein
MRWVAGSMNRALLNSLLDKPDPASICGDQGFTVVSNPKDEQNESEDG